MSVTKNRQCNELLVLHCVVILNVSFHKLAMNPMFEDNLAYSNCICSKEGSMTFHAQPFTL